LSHTFDDTDGLIMVYGFGVETKLRVRLGQKPGEILRVDVSTCIVFLV